MVELEELREHLKKYYGFNQFREYQDDIINDILNKDDLLVTMPTGGGKSLLYQFPATFLTKTTIVISPLISLMNDQCLYLNSKNINSVCLNSETTHYSTLSDYRIIYTTPEYIISNLYKFSQIKKDICLFAVDEAHCVSQWSLDFRESYLQLACIKEHFNDIPLLCVTATATPKVRDDICRLINLNDICEYNLGTRRTNLSVNVLPKKEYNITDITSPTIIYVSTRKLCEKLHEDLKTRGISCGFYHGGMAKSDKDNIHHKFINNEIIAVVATVAFGMGIDKSDIRTIINYGVPTDIETYYQEIGRAGRDGLPSNSTLYYNDSDFMTCKRLIEQTDNESHKQYKLSCLSQLRQFLLEKDLCRLKMIDYYFETGDILTPNIKYDETPPCEKCDNCLGIGKENHKDIKNDAKKIIDIIQDHKSEKGYYVGMIKLQEYIKTDYWFYFKNKPDKYVKKLICILLDKKILVRGNYNVIKECDEWYDILYNGQPILVDIEDECVKINKDTSYNKLSNIREKMSKKYHILPINFMNDRVLLNIYNSKIKSSSDLWRVDGITENFIMTYGDEFMSLYKGTNNNIFL